MHGCTGEDRDRCLSVLLSGCLLHSPLSVKLQHFTLVTLNIWNVDLLHLASTSIELFLPIQSCYVSRKYALELRCSFISYIISNGKHCHTHGNSGVDQHKPSWY